MDQKHFLREEIIMNIGFDVHGTIDRFPIFFSTLSRLWKQGDGGTPIGKVYVITARVHSEERIIKECVKAGIVYDEIIRSDTIFANPADRARLIEELDIAIMFDDLPQYNVHFPASCLTFHVRNRGNFDFVNKKWLFPKWLAELK